MREFWKEWVDGVKFREFFMSVTPVVGGLYAWLGDKASDSTRATLCAVVFVLCLLYYIRNPKPFPWAKSEGPEDE